MFDRISRVYDDVGRFTDLYHNETSVDGRTFHGATGEMSDIPAELVESAGHTLPLTWNGVMIPVRVPDNVIGTLEWRYGADFMTPRPGFKGRGQRGCATAHRGGSDP